MTEARKTATGSLPGIWVERGGPALAVVLAAIDENWAAAAWPPKPDLGRPPAADLLAAATGRLPLLAEVGGWAGVRNPDRLPALLVGTLGGDPGRLTDWLGCLFGVEVVASEVSQPTGGRPPAVRLTLAGPPPSDPAAVARVVRRLVPAHLAVDAGSITWVSEGSAP